MPGEFKTRTDTPEQLNHAILQLNENENRKLITLTHRELKLDGRELH